MYTVPDLGLASGGGFHGPGLKISGLQLGFSCSRFDGFSFSVPMFIIGVFSGRFLSRICVVTVPTLILNTAC